MLRAAILAIARHTRRHAAAGVLTQNSADVAGINLFTVLAKRMQYYSVFQRMLELADDDEDLDSVRAARRKLSIDHRQMLNDLEAELPSGLLARWRLLIRSKHQARAWRTFFYS